MTGYTGRFDLTVGLAVVAGVLLGGRHANIPMLVESRSKPGLELSPSELSLIVSALILLSVVVTVGIFLAGYRWAGRGDVPAAYGRFAVSLVGAAIVGLGVVYALLLLFIASGRLPNEVLPAIDDVGKALARVVWVSFVGLAGSTIAQYRSVTDASWRQWRSNGCPSRCIIAVVFAGIAGVLHGLGPNISLFTPVLLEDPSILGLEPSPREASRIIAMVGSVLALLTFIVTLGVFFAGYWWAGRADVPAAYGRFAVLLFVGALVGQGVGFLPVFLLRSDQPVITVLGLFGALAVSLLSVPVPGLAGGAIAQYRSVTDTS